MSILPVPDYKARSIYDLSPEFFASHGKKLLLLDLDNTLAPYSHPVPTEELRQWIESIKVAGIEPFILSNNRGSRPKTFAQELSIDYVNHCHKPFTAVLYKLLERKGVSPEDCAIVGDQIYTDVACGAKAGILTVVVRPISMNNPFHLFRYGLELPFRAAGKHKL